MTTVAQDLPKHLGNPFTAKLGPPLDMMGRYELIERKPEFDERERSYPSHLRRYCAQGLFRFVHPRACQLDLVERVGMLIRGGYEHRNPLTGQYRMGVQDAADRKDAGDVNAPPTRLRMSNATGMTLLGHPGMGKSLSVGVALSVYPEVIEHKLKDHILQVPWLKIECPSVGGRKQFCIAFFQALGDRVGRDFRKLYGRERRSPDEMMLDVQLLCHTFAVGVIVLDELQHAIKNQEGAHPLLNFLVTLTNIVGVPILTIGTMSAAPIIENGLHSGRRAAGLGQPTWERMRRGEDWDRLMADLWSYQWTAEPTPFSAEISEVLYDETQGIIDLAVKLVMLSQFRAISIGEMRRGPETMTPALIADVAEAELRVVRPMVQALKENRPDRLARYADLIEFHRHVDSVISSGPRVDMDQLRRQREADRRVEQARSSGPGDPLDSIRAALGARGLSAERVEELLAEAVRREPSRDVIALTVVLTDLLAHEPPRKPIRRPSKGASAAEAAKATGGAMPGDLRTLAAEAKRRKVSVHSLLVEAGVARTVAGAVDACA